MVDDSLCLSFTGLDVLGTDPLGITPEVEATLNASTGPMNGTLGIDTMGADDNELTVDGWLVNAVNGGNGLPLVDTGMRGDGAIDGVVPLTATPMGR